MRIILTIGMLLYSWALFAQTATERGTPRPLTFEEALLQMEQRNGEIQAAKREIEEMEYEQKAAWGLRLPSVTASAFLVRMDDDLGIETGKLTGDVKNGLKKLTPENIQTAVKGGVISLDEAKGIQTLFNGYKGIQKLTGGKLALPEKLVLQDQQFHAANVSAMLPIYAGGKIRAAYRAANLRRHEAEEKLRSVRGKLLEELVTRYYGHRLAERVVQIRKEVLAGVEHHLKDARKLEKNGMIAEAQRLYAEMAYSEASRELKKARNRLALTGTGLANTLASDVSVQPTSEL
ncbi:MAG: TolC family protein, partial [Cytophagales bacterium]|nr:TolC family protein [Cytophagales bacterium]